jgi:hypothetical protein
MVAHAIIVFNINFKNLPRSGKILWRSLLYNFKRFIAWRLYNSAKYWLLEAMVSIHVFHRSNSFVDRNCVHYLKNSLIIHEENTKKNHKRVVSVYVIQIHVDLHKLKLWFSRLRQRLFLKLLRQWTHKMSRFLSHLQHSRPCCIGYTNTRLRLEFVYPIQHGRSCCK